MTPQIDHLRKNQPVLKVSTHIYGISKEIDGENIHFFLSKPRHVTPQIDRLGKIMSLVLRVSTHIHGVSKEIDGKTFILQLNLGMWPPQIDHLGKQALLSRVSTHIYGVSKEIDGKLFILQSKPRHLIPQIDHLRKQVLFWGFQHTFIGVSKEIDGKMFIFRVNLSMWPLKLITWDKTWALLLWVSPHIYGVSKEIDGKMFIFRVNLGMWPLKLIILENNACSEGFNTHLWGF